MPKILRRLKGLLYGVIHYKDGVLTKRQASRPAVAMKGKERVTRVSGGSRERVMAITEEGQTVKVKHSELPT